jgi:hypothetical protein
MKISNQNMEGTQMFRQLTFLAVISLASASAIAQDQQAVRQQLFGNTDTVKAEADELNAVMLAPESYAAAMELYTEAGDTLAKGRDLDSVRENLTEADTLFARAVEAATLAQTSFASTLAARASAVTAEAATFAERDWTKAEESLIEAARTLEDGNLNKGNDIAADALERYREAEAAAINEKAKAGQ